MSFPKFKRFICRCTQSHIETLVTMFCIDDISLHRLWCLLGLLRANAEDR